MGFKEQPFLNYDPLDLSEGTFRLCKLLPAPFDTRIECELLHESIADRAEQYVALSYLWGTPTEQRWILVNGKPFHVQPNLLAALKAIRKQEVSLLVWIDAICINQNDVAERNHQVSIMGNIYRNAEQVLGWLGPAADDSDQLFDYLQRNYERCQPWLDLGTQRTEYIEDLKDPRTIHAFASLSKRVYWRRAWIKQEVILAKRVTLYCGYKFTDGEWLFRLSAFHCRRDNINCDALVRLVNTRDNIKTRPQTLEQLLYTYGAMECQDPRDGVFSLLSLASDRQGVQEQIADYSVSSAALFFALQSFMRPVEVKKLAEMLQRILQVSRSQLLGFWDGVSNVGECPESKSPVERLAFVHVRATKECKELLDSEEHKEHKESLLLRYSSAQRSDPDRSRPDQPSLGEFYIQCAIASGSEWSVETIKMFRIANTDYYLTANQTLFGLHFLSIMFHSSEDNPGPGKHSRPIVDKDSFEPTLDSDLIDDAFLLPYHLLLRKGSPLEAIPQIALIQLLYGTKLRKHRDLAVLNLYKDFMSKELGPQSVNPPVEVICCVLTRLHCLIGQDGISIDECRFLLEDVYGYKLLAAEFRRRGSAADGQL